MVARLYFIVWLSYILIRGTLFNSPGRHMLPTENSNLAKIIGANTFSVSTNRGGTKRNSVRCYLYRKSVITIQIWFDLTRLEIELSACLFMEISATTNNFEIWLLNLHMKNSWFFIPLFMFYAQYTALNPLYTIFSVQAILCTQAIFSIW